VPLPFTLDPSIDMSGTGAAKPIATSLTSKRSRRTRGAASQTTFRRRESVLEATAFLTGSGTNAPGGILNVCGAGGLTTAELVHSDPSFTLRVYGHHWRVGRDMDDAAAGMAADPHGSAG
jgi:hypothetical protein